MISHHEAKGSTSAEDMSTIVEMRDENVEEFSNADGAIQVGSRRQKAEIQSKGLLRQRHHSGAQRV